MIAYEHQKVFLEVIIVDYSSSILFLDTIPDEYSLLTLR